jgi:NAD(P)-dependent dehydrogenase (short-subunit alcohol dehydrogenase family)
MKLTPGTVAVVTGASSGIGRALALNLGARGCALALADINPVGLGETAALVEQTGAAKVTTSVVNVADVAAVARFASEVDTQHGGAQLLINNAGVALGGSFEELALDDFAWLMSINFWGVVYGVKAFLPQLLRQPAAHIVNISSVFGLAGPPGQTAYVSSKFAVRGFTESLRAEMRGTPVVVSCVHPGGVKTNIAVNARTKVTDDARVADEQKRWEKLLRMPPEQAAAIITRGIERNRVRILIGNEAYLLDALARLFPGRVGAMLARQTSR